MAELIRLEQHCNERFKTIDLDIIENSNLSWKAKGLHIYLISRPPNWRLWHEDLVRRATDGSAALRSACAELTGAGYLKIEKLDKDAEGKFTGWKWTVAQTPCMLEEQQAAPLFDQPLTENNQVGESPAPEEGKCPVPDSPRVDNPRVDNQQHSNKHGVLSNTVRKEQLPSSDKPKISKDDLTTLTEHYATIRGARPRGNAWQPIQQGFKQMVAVEGYSVEQVTGCMDRLVELEWTWAINTVRKWIADFAAGKMPGKNGNAMTEGGHDAEMYERLLKKRKEANNALSKNPEHRQEIA